MTTFHEDLLRKTDAIEQRLQVDIATSNLRLEESMMMLHQLEARRQSAYSASLGAGILRAAAYATSAAAILVLLIVNDDNAVLGSAASCVLGMLAGTQLRGLWQLVHRKHASRMTAAGDTSDAGQSPIHHQAS
jgi:hypothetical protein